MPKNPVKSTVCGYGHFGKSVFATLLQDVFLKKHFATDEIILSGFVVKACFEAFKKESAFFVMKVSWLFFATPKTFCKA